MRGGLCVRGGVVGVGMRSRILLWGVLVWSLAGWHCLPAAAEPVVRVAAASSLADVLKDIATEFTKATGVKVELAVGGSSGLARQIAAGAPADVFISADASKMDELEKAGLIEPGTREDQLSNRLVVVVPKGSALKISSLGDLASGAVATVVTGDPRAVPVGVYARQSFEKLGLWARVKPKIVSVESVRAALAAVESGSVDAGIVYRTDAAISKKVSVAFEVPESGTPSIVYPMAVLKQAADRELARRFLEHLDADGSRKAFERFGFIVLPEADGRR